MFEDNEDKMAISPAEDIGSLGSSEPDQLDQDREDFPGQFDANAWPKFGKFDPYARTHPLTGRPWYEAPREPSSDEPWSDYETWYSLALEFNDVLGVLMAVRDLTGNHSQQPVIRRSLRLFTSLILRTPLTAISHT